ncbi:MAG: PspC domain-containing protein [Nocardioides sp.]|uniref:PspC domain-containing protein n=1 Tax=Nocardioides sp. TaxID=35761 RepID=UPI003F0E1969
MDNAAPTPGAQPGSQPGPQTGPQPGGQAGPQPDGDPVGQPTQAPPAGAHDGHYRAAVRDLAELRRSRTNRHVAGVAGGVARHFDVDPIVIRILLVVLTFFGGAGLIAYVGLWLMVPEEETPARPFGLDDRSRSVAVMIVGGLSGVIALASVAGNGLENLWWLGPVAAFVMLALVLTERSRRNAHQSPYGQPPYGQPPYGQAPYGTPAAPAAPAPGGAQGSSAAPGPVSGEATSATPVPSEDVEMTAPFAAYATAGQQAPTTWSPEQRAAAPTAVYPDPTRSYPMPPPPRRTNPRKRGPILFWFTLALIAVGIGVVSLMELTGVAVADSAYPAVALGVTATMLLVGAFWGRAGGLVALGLLLSVLTVGVTSAEQFERDDQTFTPTTASQVADRFEMHAGTFVLDLREVSDPARLSGREITIDAGAGEVRVILPAGIDARVSAEVGVGESTLFGENVGGLGTSHTRGSDTGATAPDIEISIDLGVGSVVVEQESGELS